MRKSEIGSSIDWVFPTLRRPVFFWNIASSITVAAVGIFAKIFIRWFNKPKIHNVHYLHRALQRPSHIPLLTVSNHHSCFDDPGLWASLDWSTFCSRRKMRWTLAAHDICFTKTFHSYFFMLGKCIPIIRGRGVYQEAVNFVIQDIMPQGEWLHIFPEGKVNMTKEELRFKWGIGRIIYESPVIPIIVPMWHIGMDQILHNEPPYYLRTNKRVTFNFGNPIDLRQAVAKLREANVKPKEARKKITDLIQKELYALKTETEELHAKFTSS
ncbi:unnamed protein product [Bemisia tabaci]|uniref:Tafazzin family protein n=1 Tax=Bemisia tabaci TaxID=7038 RepID=A0A9P0ANQ2_BEMTA|nr:unnamed protein product [Bemisia tabaci]